VPRPRSRFALLTRAGDGLRRTAHPAGSEGTEVICDVAIETHGLLKLIEPIMGRSCGRSPRGTRKRCRKRERAVGKTEPLTDCRTLPVAFSPC
jgi:hypothetical protein